MLLIVSETTIQQVERAIVTAARSAVELASGKGANLGTIDPRMLRIAALCAVQTATGETVWPDSAQLEIPAPKQTYGIIKVG